MSRRLAPYVSGLHQACLARGGRAQVEVLGTLVFADVSGFTPLAERLARRGKVGAEELTNTLNAVFRELLGVAGAAGGDCLKFGGDALLILFSGEGHAQRAAGSAHDMLAALRSLRRRGSGAGLAKLDMSVGVHTGLVNAFLGGRSHHELILAGPAVSGVLELEGIAQGGQVLVSAATAAALHPDDVEPLGETGLLLRRRPTDVPPWKDGPAVDPEAVDAALGVPERVRAHLDGAAQDGEHRVAAIGFLKFGGTDRLLADGGPAALLDALDALVATVQEACAAHGVTFVATDVDADGGKVILATGMPTVSPDDVDRLLLALHTVLTGSGDIPLDLRAGVNGGRIFAVDLGSSERRTFTVMGDVVNLAARVMGQAAWGQIVATDTLVERTRTAFSLEPLPPFTVKGKSEPISARVVGAPVGRRTEDAGGLPLVGRTAQQELIGAAFASAHDGAGAIVEVVGEPGIGKSRLVAAMTDQDHGLTPFIFEAGRYSLATPYYALRRGLRQAMGLSLDTPAAEVETSLRAIVAAAAPHLDPWIPLLGIPLGLELEDTAETGRLDPSNRQARLHGSVTELMELLLDGPTLITIEDSHWLDSASCELLRSLLDGVTGRPWAVLVTRRPVPGGLVLEAEEVRRIALEPLDRADLVALAAAATDGAALPPGVVDGLIDRSGGNPLFLHELVSAWLQGALAELPESIEAVVGTTIDALPTEDRALVRHAAVLGGQFPAAALAAMLDRPVEHVQRDIRRMGHYLVMDESAAAARFRHILLRDVAYEALPYKARRELHGRAATILEQSAPDPEAIAELLSIHFHRAGEYASSWRYSGLAGDRARRTGAPVEASAFYANALEAARHVRDVADDERADVAERLGDTWELGGRYELASDAYAQARRLARGEALRTARLYRKSGLVRDHEGRYSEAKRWFTKGVRALDDMASTAEAMALRAQLRTASVSVDVRRGRHGKAIPLMEEAVREAESSGDRAALAFAYYVFDQLLVEHGRLDEARYSALAAPIYEELGDERGAAAAYNEQGITAYWQGRWDDAVTFYERAVDSDRRAGALVNNAIYLNNIAEIRSDQGRWQEAESLLVAAHDLWAGGGWRIGEGWALSNLGRVAARDGRLDEAQHRLRRAIEVLSEIGADAMLLETEVRELERLVLAGQSADVRKQAGTLLQRARAMDAGYVAQLVERVEGYAWCQAGAPDRGWELLASSLDGSRARGAEYETALTLEAMARIALAVGCGDGRDMRAEADATFARLGVVATAEVPLPAEVTDALAAG